LQLTYAEKVSTKTSGQKDFLGEERGRQRKKQDEK